MNSDFQIISGDALTVLREMEIGSVQCAITSPPYYGLRSYKTVPQIWDNHNGCQHVWGDDLPYAKQDKRSPELKASQGASVGNSVNSIGFAVGSSGNFCHCGAWRGELGLEPTFHLYISHLVQIFAEVKRVLKADGTCFVNLGDSYAGSGKGIGSIDPKWTAARTDGNKHKTDWSQINVPAKSLMNIPHRFFIAMTDELQMIQRNNINWFKRACMPSSATDRWTVDFESIGFFSKNAKYKFNQDLEPLAESSIARFAQPNFKNQTGSDRAHGQMKTNGNMKAVRTLVNRTAGGGDGSGELGNSVRFGDKIDQMRNARTTFDIPYEPSGESHYASYPTKLAEKMILAGTDPGDTVLDIFNGTASTGHAAIRNQRRYIGIELNPDYIAISEKRLREVQVRLFS